MPAAQSHTPSQSHRTISRLLCTSMLHDLMVKKQEDLQRSAGKI